MGDEQEEVRWGRSMESQMRKEHGESDGRGTGGGQTEEEYGGSHGEEHGGSDGVRTEEVRWRRNMGIRWGRNMRRSDGGGTWGSDRGGAWRGSDMSALLAYLGLQKLASPGWVSLVCISALLVLCSLFLSHQPVSTV